MAGNGFIRIYHLTNSTYEIAYSQVLPNHTVIGFWFSQDENTLILSLDYEVHLMEYDGNTYQTIEILNGLPAIASVIRPSANQSLLYIGLNNKELRVYEKNGLHSLIQTTSLSFEPQQINFVHGLIQLNGVGSEILFLEYDGSQYVVNQSIVALDRRIKSVSYFENNEKFVFGGDQEKIKFFKRVNGMFVPEE